MKTEELEQRSPADTLSAMNAPCRPSRSDKAAWWPLALLIGFYAVSQTWWFLSIPLGQAPDESDHADYVNYLLERRELPKLGETPLFHGTAETRWSLSRFGSLQYEMLDPRWARQERAIRSMPSQQAWRLDSRWLNAESAQPPLSYAVTATLLRPMASELSPIGRWQLIRLASTAFGFGAVLAGYFLGRWIWRRNDPVLGGLVLGTWMAALPMAAFSRATASNDALQACLASWLFFFLVTRRKRNLVNARTAGLLAGLSLLTKASSLALVPVIAVWGIWRGAGDRLTRRVRAVVVSMGIPGIALGAYWLATARELGWYYTGFVQKWFPPVETVPDLWPAVHQLLEEMVLFVPEGFFGLFGWLNIPRSGASLWTTWIVTAGAVAGGLWTASAASRRRQRIKDESGLDAPTCPLRLHAELRRGVWLGGVVVATFVAMLAIAGYRNLVTVGTSTLQGRHLLFLQLPIGLLLIGGWTMLARLTVGRPVTTQAKRTGSGPSAAASLALASLLAGVMVLLNWEDLFSTVARISYEGLRPSIAGMLLGDPIFRQVCATLPPALKIPALWKAAYIIFAVLAVSLPAVIARLWTRREESRLGRLLTWTVAGTLIGLLLRDI